MKERILNGIVSGLCCLIFCISWSLWFTEISEFLIDFIMAATATLTIGAFFGGLALKRRKRINAVTVGLLVPLVSGLIVYIAYPIEF
jgi:beta-lactamase regulating signal transducer with metallopeptidase domain